MCNLCLDARFSRRLFLGAGAATVAAASLARGAQAQPTRAADTPEAALKLLLEGNERYVAGKLNERDFSSGRAAGALGQAPFAAILGCADSRVAPELAFDRGPGDLFVVRVAGNVVTPEELGSLEYGAAVLGTRLIMVLGHTSCSAVKATIAALQEGDDPPGHIADLVRAMKPGVEAAVKRPGTGLELRAVIANVLYNVRRLQQGKPILAEMVASGKLRVIGGVYDLASGKLSLV